MRCGRSERQSAAGSGLLKRFDRSYYRLMPFTLCEECVLYNCVVVTGTGRTKPTDCGKKGGS